MILATWHPARRLAWLGQRWAPGDDRGSYTLVGMVFGLTLIMMFGLVLDGGAKLRAGQQASSVAEEAARAGAGIIDRDRAYAGGRIVVDRTGAIRAASAYLQSSGHTGTVSATGPHQIRVTVTVGKPTRVLSLVGIGSMRVTRTATADLLSGVEGPGR
ncbi:pilus assembly protein TadG-related protein [Actinomadura sp. 6N118]|uniref:pilus assembly protein TadG-related protein n=1 Tax=Actinomadura sp. 6N118 TaxID=3375151 RepID=UPI0037AF34AC